MFCDRFFNLKAPGIHKPQRTFLRGKILCGKLHSNLIFYNFVLIKPLSRKVHVYAILIKFYDTYWSSKHVFFANYIIILSISVKVQRYGHPKQIEENQNMK